MEPQERFCCQGKFLIATSRCSRVQREQNQARRGLRFTEVRQVHHFYRVTVVMQSRSDWGKKSFNCQMAFFCDFSVTSQVIMLPNVL
jgi:hypothetical protein